MPLAAYSNFNRPWQPILADTDARLLVGIAEMMAEKSLHKKRRRW